MYEAVCVPYATDLSVLSTLQITRYTVRKKVTVCLATPHGMLQIMCLPVLAGVGGDDIMSGLCSNTVLLVRGKSLGPSSCLTAAAVEQMNHIITAVSWSHKHTAYHDGTHYL